MNKALSLLAPFLLLAGCASSPTLEEEIEHERALARYGYKVVEVLDGDTLVVDLTDMGDGSGFRRVRLAGIDAPSIRDFMEPGGRDAHRFLRELLMGKYVKLRFDTAFQGPSLERRPAASGGKEDLLPAGAYVDPDSGMLLAYVTVKGTSVNLLMLQNGLARVSKSYMFSHKKVRDEFLSWEKNARKNHRGIWR